MSKLSRREFLRELGKIGQLSTAGLLAASIPQQLRAGITGGNANTNRYGIWIPTNPTSAPTARYDVTGVWDPTNAKVMFWGGYNGTTAFAEGALYDPITDTWATISPTSGLAGRYYHSAVFCSGRTIVWGGLAGIYQNDGSMFNGSTWTATSTGANVPAARYDHTGTDCGGLMAIWGGTGASLYANGAVLDPVGNSWTTINATGAPAARRQHSAVWTGSKYIVWGGTNGSSLQSGGVYDPTSWGAGTWTATSTTGAVPSTRCRHTAVWTGTRMIVWGGGTGTTGLNDGASYDPTGNTWTAIATNAAIGPRMGHCAYWTGSEMIIFGGSTGTIYYNDGWAYNPVSDSWRPLFISDPDRAITVTTGTPGTINLAAHGYLLNEQVVLVASSAPSGLTNGAIYYVNNPAANTFELKTTIGGGSVAITTAGAGVKFRRLISAHRQPGIRANFGSVWIPARKDLVVWGGKDINAGGLNSGGVLRVYF